MIVDKNIDTDQIYPGRYLELVEPEEIAKYAMEGVDPDFFNRFNRGDIIVADKNFRCGSSREHAVITLKIAGVAAIIAPSFARIFYRNAINLGLPLITCSNSTDFVKEGEELVLQLETGLIKNKTTVTEINEDPRSPFVLEMISYGGIKQYYIHKHQEK
ncbi:3-isopropylmalate dehydratase [Clostridium formicaceticum]|uniref:2,3-dimethylmalate dehydratase small subunit n=1 Tax=Clostridium formicaceticum TaxID=1497 RepID=A0AAC9RNE9_9CLOT|nr:3-isopropylmalate dehydratase [Clostridium formicaceticum]AOY77769.1 3-isopropylmalate dehydratase [Clostridium formicaceticum]ARE88375.1 2,3-dimethylmalate dehydratase small subunit [Clostridium formicaceticum]